jgi:hypothetical protein
VSGVQLKNASVLFDTTIPGLIDQCPFGSN